MARMRVAFGPGIARRIAFGLLLLALGGHGVVAGQAEIPGVEVYANISAAHVQGPIEYPQVPPVGGPHNPIWVNCGVYEQPVPSEMAVHSLEHGAVWITYRLDL